MRLKNSCFLVVIFLLVSGLGFAEVESVINQPQGFSSLTKPLETDVAAALANSSQGLFNDSSGGLGRSRILGDKSVDSLNAIVIMCDFSDSLLFGRHSEVNGVFPPPQQTEVYYSAHDSTFFHHRFMDVREYYSAVSGGQFSFNFTIHSQAVNLNNPMSYYGNHPVEKEQPVVFSKDVVTQVDPEIDFSLYDTVILIHAGAGGETDVLGDSPEQMYSTYIDKSDLERAFEDETINQPYIFSEDFGAGNGITNILILPECEYQDPIGSFKGRYGSLGVYCFEIGLRLGMLSLSDFTPSGRPDSQGIGQFGLMGHGLFSADGWIPPQPCAYNKLLMGWLDPFEADPDENADHWLTPAENTSDSHAAIKVDITGQEYWLLSYRQQDPDGNRIFSFEGDLNGNHQPDFYDADSVFGNGVPRYGVDKFDAAAGDIPEHLSGAEWDFFMSHNTARAPGEKGAGSGVYIWHIDEGVINAAAGSPRNIYNADPERKAVDLEEADGIQDLDSRDPSAFFLGADDDSFRGEDNSQFGPNTMPNTDTSGGAGTGIIFSEFSDVVLDSLAYTWVNEAAYPPATLQGLDYADTVRFRIMREPAAANEYTARIRRQLPGQLNTKGSHLLAVDLSGGNGLQSLVFAGQSGEIYVLDGQMNEHVDHDNNPETIEPFAVGTFAGEPVIWNLPATAGDIDGDGELEILLTGPNGLYAFNSDGTAVVSSDPANFGLYAEVSGCSLPPTLYAVNGETFETNPAAQVRACVISQAADESQLRLFGGLTGEQIVVLELGRLLVTAPPVGNGDTLFITCADTATFKFELLQIQPSTIGQPGSPETTFELPFIPGPHAPLFDVSNENLGPAVIVSGVGGQIATVRLSDGNVVDWDNRFLTRSAFSGGLAFASRQEHCRASISGEWVVNWPKIPLNPIQVPSVVSGASPLSTPGNGGAYYFTSVDGRVFAYSGSGVLLEGWPLAGPGEVAGTPVLARLRPGGYLDLVTIGCVSAITGYDEVTEELQTQERTAITVWSDVCASDESGWLMWGGSPWRSGINRTTSQAANEPGQQVGLWENSHMCYPSPLMESDLYVRAVCGTDGQAKAFIYNLEGELVTRSNWSNVIAEEPFSIQVDMDNAVTGIYLCRLVIETTNGQSYTNVIQLAVVH